MDPHLKVFLAYATFGLIPRIHGKAMDSFEKAWQDYKKAQQRNKNAREVSDHIRQLADEALNELIKEVLDKEKRSRSDTPGEQE